MSVVQVTQVQLDMGGSIVLSNDGNNDLLRYKHSALTLS